MEAEILRYGDENVPGMLATLEKLVAIDSGTYDKAGVDAVGAIMARALGDLGFDVTRLPQTEMGDHLVARLGAGQGRRDVGHAVAPGAGGLGRAPSRVW